MRFLVKMAFVIVVVYMIVKHTRVGERQVTYVMNLSGNVVTQQEVRSLCSMIHGSYGGDPSYFPNKSDAYWTDFIRSQMDTGAKGRDTGKDIWQTPYRVRKLETVPGRGCPGFTVISAGPDKTFGTGDDISAVMTL